MQVRELTVKDVFAVTRMLGKVQLPERKDDAQGYGIAIVFAALRDAEEDLKEWLADMVGKTKAEFEAMPPSAILDVIEGIMAQDGAKDFFVRLSKLLGSPSFSSGTAGQMTPSKDSA